VQSPLFVQWFYQMWRKNNMGIIWSND